MTNSRLTDPEVLEWRFPVLLEEFAIRRGSGGAGRWRGGDGAVRRHPVPRADDGEHPVRPPAGAAVRHGRRRTRRAGRQPRGTRRRQRRPASAGCDSVDVEPGDVLVIETPGGGGYGS